MPWPKVAERAEGLILLSGGPDGPVDPLFAAGRAADAERALAEMQRVFGDRFYIELQRHGLATEAAAEPGLVAYAYEHDIPLVATNDVYFARGETYRAHEALLCIADGAFLGQDERRRVTAEHWFKGAADMRRLFADLPEACDNTLDIARRCAFMVKKRDPVLPRFPTARRPQRGRGARRPGARGPESPARWPRRSPTRRLTGSGWRREIGVIQSMGFSGYFLIVSDFMKWAVAHGIPVGPGRGSGAGSVVAWSLLITGVDPMRFNLIFERFLNPERVSMPDFDIDFCQERREEVIAYVQAKYGRDRVAQIITFGTLQARAVLRDVGRVLQLPLGLVDRLAKMVPNNPANPVTLAKSIEIEPRLQEARKREEGVAELLDIALQLEGLYRNASTHAAGIVIGDRPLTELVPLYRDSALGDAGHPVQHEVGRERRPGEVRLPGPEDAHRHRPRDGLPAPSRGRLPARADCRSTIQRAYEMMSVGQTLGVFQMEGQGMRDILRQLRPSHLEEVSDLISLYRPGPMDSIPEYVECKAGRKPVGCRSSADRGCARADLRGDRLPGAGDEDRPDPGRLQPGRGRPAAPRHGQEEEVRDGPAARPLPGRRGRARRRSRPPPRCCSTGWRSSRAMASTRATRCPTR